MNGSKVSYKKAKCMIADINLKKKTCNNLKQATINKIQTTVSSSK